MSLLSLLTSIQTSSFAGESTQAQGPSTQGLTGLFWLSPLLFFFVCLFLETCHKAQNQVGEEWHRLKCVLKHRNWDNPQYLLMWPYLVIMTFQIYSSQGVTVLEWSRLLSMTGELIRMGKRTLPQQGHLEHPEVDKSRSPLSNPFYFRLTALRTTRECLFVCLL